MSLYKRGSLCQVSFPYIQGPKLTFLGRHQLATEPFLFQSPDGKNVVAKSVNKGERQLCTLSCGRQKKCRLVLCSKTTCAKTIFPFTFCQNGRRCSRQATTVQLLNRLQYVCSGKPLKKHGDEASH